MTGSIRTATIDLLRMALRIAAGTLVYVTIIVLAGVLPPAAGLMLTFPALNGLAFFFSDDGKAAPMARTMFWMPVINGFLCALYIILFLAIGFVSSSALTGWLLLLLVAGFWYAWVSRKIVIGGIKPKHQLAYGIGATLVGIMLVKVASFWTAHPAEALPNEIAVAGWEHAGWIIEAISLSRFKIVLFALALSVFALSAAYLPISDATRGILGGLPIVPFGGLVSVAGDFAMGVQMRFEILRGMLSSVWLGPAVAIWFIYYVSRYYSVRNLIKPEWVNELVRFAAVAAGWIACFAVIIAVSTAISTLS